jgi:hypothetical protein
VSSIDGEPQFLDPKTYFHSPGSLNSRTGHTKQYSVFARTIIEERRENAGSETPELVVLQEIPRRS